MSSTGFVVGYSREAAGTRHLEHRAAHATLMLTNGVHPKVVPERLGHAAWVIYEDLS